MKKLFTFFSALLILFAGCSFAATSNDNKVMKPDSICANYNKLTKDQKADIDKTVTETMGKLQPLHQKLMADFEALHEQIMQSPVDEKLINQTVDDIISVKSQIFRMHVQTAVEVEKKYGFIPMCCTMKGHCPMMQKGITRQSDLEAMMMACQKDPTCQKK